jgi:hypothetical protein
MKRRMFLRAALGCATAPTLSAALGGKRWDDAADVLERAAAGKRVDTAVLHVARRGESFTRHFGKAGSRPSRGCPRRSSRRVQGPPRHRRGAGLAVPEVQGGEGPRRASHLRQRRARLRLPARRQAQRRRPLAPALHGVARRQRLVEVACSAARESRASFRYVARLTYFFARFHTASMPSSSVVVNSRGLSTSPVSVARRRVNVSPSSL